MNNSEFEKIIRYEFSNKELLNRALTHSSYSRESGKHGRKNNERLEFLGDAFFDAIISVQLFEQMNGVNEGTLTKTRAQIVCEKSLAKVGKRLNIGEYLNMGKGEDMLGGRHRDSIIADSVEAVIGALFLDGGYSAAETFVQREFFHTVEAAIDGKLFTDFKTRLQEEVQKVNKSSSIKYIIDRTEGPDHNKTFFVHLELNGEVLGRGKGKSKKEAEQQAARNALVSREK